MATMTQVQIEVEGGASRFLVSVRAATVERALRLVGERNPGARVRVVPTKSEAPLARTTRQEETLGAETNGSAA